MEAKRVGFFCLTEETILYRLGPFHCIIPPDGITGSQRFKAVYLPAERLSHLYRRADYLLPLSYWNGKGHLRSLADQNKIIFVIKIV